MQEAHTTRTIHATPEQVWNLVSDLRTVQQYNPTVTSVDLLTDAAGGLGAQRRCHFADGTDVREEIIASDEGQRLRLSLSEFSLPMKQLESEITLAPTADGKTQVTFTIAYDMKLGLLGRAMGATVVHHQLGKATAKMVAGMAHHLATGEEVGPDFKAA